MVASWDHEAAGEQKYRKEIGKEIIEKRIECEKEAGKIYCKISWRWCL